MLTFLLWILLLIICWPLALIALFLYPIFWLLSIPFRIFGFVVEGLLKFIKSLFLFPSRILGGK
ncbi:MAG: hypothetical protein C4543_00110 [Ignavibacteriales bacterium]|nr:MAG: hypothetical protein C4543_00110 [Ignavibacteriales bacterium]